MDMTGKVGGVIGASGARTVRLENKTLDDWARMDTSFKTLLDAVKESFDTFDGDSSQTPLALDKLDFSSLRGKLGDNGVQLTLKSFVMQVMQGVFGSARSDVLNYANLDGADLRFIDLGGADLSYANLKSTKLGLPNSLRGIKINKACLQGATALKTITTRGERILRSENVSDLKSHLGSLGIDVSTADFS